MRVRRRQQRHRPCVHPCAITLLLQARYDSDIFMRPLSFMNYELPVVDLGGNAKTGPGAGNVHYSRVLEVSDDGRRLMCHVQGSLPLELSTVERQTCLVPPHP